MCASLADLRRKSLKNHVSNVIEKSKKLNKGRSTTKKGTDSYTRLKNLCEMVEQKLAHLKDNFECITDENRLKEYIDKAIENGYISIDTETTGLDPITDEIVGGCIYTPGEKAAYIPINHISAITRTRLQNQLTNEQVGNQFKRLKENNTKIIYFNAKFDIRVMRHQLGVDLPCYWDGFIAGKVLKENEEESNLKYLWKKYCSPNKDAPHFTFDKLFKDVKFNLVPMKTATLYAANDAIITWELYKFQEQYLDENSKLCQDCGFTKLAKLYKEIELPIIPIIADIEDNGISLDLEYSEKLSIKYHKLLDESLAKFQDTLSNYEDKIQQYRNTHPYTKLGNPINIASPTQLAELFYDVLGVESVSRKQPRGTGSDILEKINHPLCANILEYRGYAKLLSTYIDKMPTILNSKTHKIHCNFHQYGADCVTGDTVIPNIEFPGYTIKQICENTIKEMQDGVYYPLKITIFNRYGELENTSNCVKYSNQPVIKLSFEDGSNITGTYKHGILMEDNIFKELKYIKEGEFVINPFGNKIKVIKKEFSKEDVYDFKVPCTHSFTSNNVISHNTGRFSCIAAGSLISMPGGDKKIENVKPGDYVYTYNEEGKLCLNKVLNNYFTGNRKCIKLNWISKYNHKLTGSLICTPEHPIKTTRGWIKAEELRPDDSIYHVHRYENKNCVSLYGHKGQGNKEEHIWLKQNHFNCYNGKIHIHHKDHNRFNNDPSNLILCTPKQHNKLHREFRDGYCGAYDFTYQQLIKMCNSVKWDIRKLPYDYESLKIWLKQNKINYIDEYTRAYRTRSTTLRSDGTCFKYKSLPLNKENLLYALELSQGNIDLASSYFGENKHKFNKACERYKIFDNHNVVEIEHLESFYSVYDLQIEGNHCYIANELCVHNSSDPNMQNIPSHNKDIRRMFTGSGDVKVQFENVLSLLPFDEVKTNNGFKKGKDLTLDDTIICDNNKFLRIRSINNCEGKIQIEIV